MIILQEVNCLCAGTLNTKDDSRGLVALAVQAVLPVCLLPTAVPALGPEPANLSLSALLVLVGLHGLGATLPARIGQVGGLPNGLIDTGVSWVRV